MFAAVQHDGTVKVWGSGVNDLVFIKIMIKISNKYRKKAELAFELAKHSCSHERMVKVRLHYLSI